MDISTFDISKLEEIKNEYTERRSKEMNEYLELIKTEALGGKYSISITQKPISKYVINTLNSEHGFNYDHHYKTIWWNKHPIEMKVVSDTYKEIFRISCITNSTNTINKIISGLENQATHLLLFYTHYTFSESYLSLYEEHIFEYFKNKGLNIRKDRHECLRTLHVSAVDCEKKEGGGEGNNTIESMDISTFNLDTLLDIRDKYKHMRRAELNDTFESIKHNAHLGRVSYCKNATYVLTTLKDVHGFLINKETTDICWNTDPDNRYNRRSVSGFYRDVFNKFIDAHSKDVINKIITNFENAATNLKTSYKYRPNDKNFSLYQKRITEYFNNNGVCVIENYDNLIFSLIFSWENKPLTKSAQKTNK